MKEKYILITGGAGYIGSHTAELLLNSGAKLVIVDNLFRGFQGAVDALKQVGIVEFVKADLRNKDELKTVFEQYPIEAVVHFASLLSVNESMEKPEFYFRNNLLGSLNLLETMHEHNVKKLVFSSTCAVYGETQYVPVDEQHPTLPVNPYGESKLIIEKMIKWFGVIHGLKYAILRYFNVCGSSESGLIGYAQKPSTHLMQNAVKGALGIEPFYLTCPKVDTPDGSPIRDYVDVIDLANAHALALKYLDNGLSDAFNIGTGKGNSVLEIVSAVEKQLGVQLPKQIGETRAGEYARIFADYTKAEKLLGWKPTRSLDDSIRTLTAWFRSHPDGY